MENKLKSIKELKELVFDLSQTCYINLQQNHGLQDYLWIIDLEMQVGTHFNTIKVLNNFNIKDYHIKNYELGKLSTRVEIEIGE